MDGGERYGSFRMRMNRCLLGSLVVLGCCLPGCGSPCPDDACERELVVRVGTEDDDFAEGDVMVRLEIDDDEFECTTTLPDDAEAITDCGPAQVSYVREQECAFQADSGGVRCTLTGALHQTIALLDDPPEALHLQLAVGEDVFVDEDLEPEFERPNPDRAECSNCPRTVLELAAP